MKKEDAVKIFTESFPDYDIGKITETKSYFLISVVPKNRRPSTNPRLVTFSDGLKAVDKVSGRIFTYNPIRHGK